MKWLLALFFMATPAFAQYPVGTWPIGTAPTVIIPATSMAVSVTGPTIPVWSLDNLDFQAVWTGTPIGVFSVQVSEDGINWDTLPLTPAIGPGGGPGHATADLSVVGAPYVHFVYTSGSGTGTLVVTAFGKVHQ